MTRRWLYYKMNSTGVDSRYMEDTALGLKV